MTESTLYKFPVWKLWLFLVVLCAGIIAVSTFDAIMHPTISAEIAVGQLEDTESGAIAMRAYNRVQNFFPLGIMGSTVFVGLFLVFGARLFWVDLAQLFPKPMEN